ncbi:MAG: response regulator [Mucilaginibacter sp.]
MRFILVDDDNFNNMLHDIMIKSTLGYEVAVETFTQPEKGLEFLQENAAEGVDHTVLLLDIDMPKISGWDFLAMFEEFTDEVKMQVSIYVLSISLDHRDSNKAGDNKNVKGFISKPLTSEVIVTIAGNEFNN